MIKKKEIPSEFPQRQILEKIKTIQSLPDEIVVRFLTSRGMLKKTDFRNRVELSEIKD